MNPRMIKQDRVKSTVVLTLSNPPANALGTTLFMDLKKAIDILYKDHEVRSIVVTGDGDRFFSAGADIKEMATHPLKDRKRYLELGHSILANIESIPKITIAALNGYALGGGFELALACDFRLASPTASVALPEVTLGLIPGWGGTQRLPRLIGVGRAKDVILTGRIVPAEEAFRIGMITKVVDHGNLLEAALSFAEDIATRTSPSAIAAAKEAIRNGLEKMRIREALLVEKRKALEVSETSDAREGLTAFLEKRKPAFKGG